MMHFRRNRRRLTALAALLAFVLAWVVPAQMCLASMVPGVAAQTGCPDCPPPCCEAGKCDLAVASACAMAPVMLATAHAQHKAILAPLLLAISTVQPDTAGYQRLAPEHASAHSPTVSVNIRFCSFLE